MLVGVPLVVAGAAIAGHGSMVVHKSLREFPKHKEEVNSSGRIIMGPMKSIRI